MGKVSAYFKLTRIEHGIIASVAAVTGCALGAGGWMYTPLIQAVLAIVITVLVEAGLFIFNDIYNIDEDKINAPYRPLVTGEISLKEAIMAGYLTLLLGTALSLFLGIMPLVVVLAAITSGMAYNVRYKRLGFIGNLVVSLDTSLPFLFGATVTSGYQIPLLAVIFTLIAFVATLGREVLKGIRDLEGDKRVGIKTIAVVKGRRFAAFLAAVLFIFAILLSLIALPLIHDQGKRAIYTALVSVTDTLFSFTAIYILLKQDIRHAENSRKITLLAMLLGTIAFSTAA
ncbi:MAG: UbiA family prenyltransferase [Thermofilaceae archaeon]